MITLCFMKGLNKTNVPHYKNEDDRDSYIAKQTPLVRIDGFYPPYYRNVINLTYDDLGGVWNVNYNYCILDFNNKKYYYYISDVAYISEDIVEITIEMDTITTFMFDIKFQNGTIERKFINRWNTDGTINRNYIRENVSNNLFDKPEVQCLNDKLSDWIVVAKCGKYPYEGRSLAESSTNFRTEALVHDGNDGLYNSPYVYGIFPFVATGTVDNKQVSYNVGAFSTVPDILDMYLIPFNGAKGYANDGHEHITWPGVLAMFYKTDAQGAIDWYGLTNTLLTNSVCTKDVHMGFYKNKNLGVPYASRFSPVLLDENYIQVSIGDTQFEATYPLYYAVTPNMRCAYWADLSNGTRYYNIVFKNKNNYPYPAYNEFNTIVVNPNILSDDLKNDPWKQYLSANKFSYINATLQDMGSVARTAYTLGNEGDMNSDFDSIFANSKNYDRRYKLPTLKKTTRRKMNEMIDEASGDFAMNSMKMLGNSSVGAYIINKSNLEYAPKGIRQTGSISKEFGGGGPYIYYKCSKVQDYIAVSWYYHTNGYLVMEPFVNKDLFNYVSTRKYYNVLKLSDVNFYLTVAQPIEVLADIEDRLLSGIILWEHTDTGTLGQDYVDIGDFSLDNVETSFITEG